MKISEQEKQRMNEIYFALPTKQAELFHGLYHRVFELSNGFYNGHEHQTPDGGWQIDYYPIPVISVKGYCDVEISLGGISVTTRKKRKDALDYSSEKLKGYSFEAFGVESYFGYLLPGRHDRRRNEGKYFLQRGAGDQLLLSAAVEHRRGGHV